jgi:hypothetical protein
MFSAVSMEKNDLPKYLDKHSSSSLALSRLAILWALFFLICLSLGYPTLNRYSPNLAATTAETPHASLVDTKYYTLLIEKGFDESPHTIWRYRVLVPYLAKPFYEIFKNHIGSWNPLYFSLLVANSLFVASTAIFLLLIGAAITGSRAVGFISSLLLLTHFNISNLYLAGLVDSSELFLMVLTAWVLFQKKWYALPFIALLAFLARETAVFFTIGLASSWLLVEIIRGEIKQSEFYIIPVYILIAVCVGFGGIMLLIYIGTSEIAALWRFSFPGGGSFNYSNISPGTWGLITSKSLFYGFVWLLPLGLLGIRSIPQNWLWASILTTGAAMILIVLVDAGENAVRPLFNIAGPMLLIGAASFITGILKLDRLSS